MGPRSSGLGVGDVLYEPFMEYGSVVRFSPFKSLVALLGVVMTTRQECMQECRRALPIDSAQWRPKTRRRRHHPPRHSNTNGMYRTHHPYTRTTHARAPPVARAPLSVRFQKRLKDNRTTNAATTVDTRQCWSAQTFEFLVSTYNDDLDFHAHLVSQRERHAQPGPHRAAHHPGMTANAALLPWAWSLGVIPALSLADHAPRGRRAQLASSLRMATLSSRAATWQQFWPFELVAIGSAPAARRTRAIRVVRVRG